MTNQFYAKPQLTIGQAVNEAKNKLVDFSGRSRRSEYWWCYLIVIIANFTVGFIPIFGSLITTLLGLAMIPLMFRRLHDTGRSGWWWGAGCILGVIVVISVIFSLMPYLKDIAYDEAAMEDPEFVLELMKVIFTNPFNLILFAVSFIYEIVLLVFTCLDSHPEPNKYGESPKYVIED